MTAGERKVITAFHRLYYDGPRQAARPWERTRWMGVPCQKCPLDLWVYQEIIFEVRPDLIIETGTLFGGSALYMAHMLDLVGKGRIVSIDVETRARRPVHPRIRYVRGSSTDPEVLRSIMRGRRRSETRMVVLDSDHANAHVTEELRLFANVVSRGSYLIVEDTDVNGNPVLPALGPGPREAVEAFLKSDRRFVADRSREKLLLTFNPGGYLKRLR